MPMAQRSDSLLRDIHDARLLEQLALAVPIAECSRQVLIPEGFELVLHGSPRQVPRQILDKQLGYLRAESFHQKTKLPIVEVDAAARIHERLAG
jgi:hypothetical protein